MGEPLPHVYDIKDLERYPRDRKPAGLLWSLGFVAIFATVGWYFVSR